MYEYGINQELLAVIVILLVMFMFFLFLFGTFVYFMNVLFPKSERYRRIISDLYITAKIKKIADKEDINIDSELKILSKFDTRGKTFDRVLEERLNEKLLEDSEEKKSE